MKSCEVVVQRLDKELYRFRCAITGNFLERMRGLMFTDVERGATGLLIDRCGSIHTFFMRYAIDVVFISRDGSVRKTVAALPPQRLAAAWGAAMTMEFAAGFLRQYDIQPNDRLLCHID